MVTRINIGDMEEASESIFGRVWRYWKEETINQRLREFEMRENRAFSNKFLVKISEFLSDVEMKKLMVKKMVFNNNRESLQETHLILRKKYGTKFSEFLIRNFSQIIFESNPDAINMASKKASKKPKISLNLIYELLTPLSTNEAHLKNMDPLVKWFYRKSDVSVRMMSRIQNLAAFISGNIKWSFLVEPGHAKTDLSNFLLEYDILDNFFDKVELTSEELSQRAFDRNCLTKVRNKKLECIDSTRVRLNIEEELTKDGLTKEVGAKQKPQPVDIFGDLDCPNLFTQNQCGHGDFIHANYVLGGPLLNKFILTQAPLPHTIPDFWRMVWQEKSEFIFMLCEACDTSNLGLFGSKFSNECPYYWPRHEGDIKQFGRLKVANENLDLAMDPLFNVSHLVLWLEDEPENHLKIQHWQWDWRNFNDFNWPLRLLRRSRQSTKPTIVHCMDGCGKSGTLVLIEILLMQLLRGATSFENPMLTSAIFLRLQRRHSVGSKLEYLYAYRTILHWIEPFVVSNYHRLVLGYMFKNSGFLGKYKQLSRNNLNM